MDARVGLGRACAVRLFQCRAAGTAPDLVFVSAVSEETAKNYFLTRHSHVLWQLDCLGCLRSRLLTSCCKRALDVIESGVINESECVSVKA